MACALVIVLSPEAAIQASMAANSEGCQRPPTWVPLPVGRAHVFSLVPKLGYAVRRRRAFPERPHRCCWYRSAKSA
jgi:hypothetical protein